MSPIRCPFCEQPSPADAKFCSACGGALYLAPCPRCGAVNDISAKTCYQCRAELSGGAAHAPDVLVPTADAAKPRRFGYAQVTFGIAIAALIGVLAYYAYPRRSPVDAPPPQAPAAGNAGVREAPANAGVIRRDAAVVDAAPAKDDAAGTTTVEPATSRTKVLTVSPGSAPASQPLPDRGPVESPKAKPAAAATSDAQAGRASKARQGSAPTPVACTEQVAALGLCPPESVQKKDVKAATVSKAPISGPQSIGGSNAAGQVATPQQACTEAVAALGLCTPVPTQRRE